MRPDLDAIVRWVPQGARVLDLGCGDGSLLRSLWQHRQAPGYGVEMTHFVALTPELAEEKARVLRHHKSQMDVMRQLRGRDYADLALDLSRTTGSRAMQPYAEAFRPCLMERRIPLASMLP